MKRRSFLKTLINLLPAAIVAKEVIEHEPSKEEVMAEYERIKPRLDNQTMTYTYGTSAFLGTYTYLGGNPISLSEGFQKRLDFDNDDFELDEP